MPDCSPKCTCCRAQRWCVGSGGGLPELCRLSSPNAEIATHSNTDRFASVRLVRMRRRREYLIEVGDSREPKFCAASRRRADKQGASGRYVSENKAGPSRIYSTRACNLCHQPRGRLTVVCRPCSRALVAGSPDQDSRITSSTHNPVAVR